MIGHWLPRIGDPSFAGWFTVFSYYACAGLSLAYFYKARRRLNKPGRRFAVAMTGLLVVLGLIKNFNLLSAVSNLGRLLAEKGGWIETRRAFQLGLMILVAAGFVVLLIRAVKSGTLTPAWKDRAPEIACLAYLCVFVLLRGISLHQFGVLLSREILGIEINRIAELGGLGVLALILIVRLFANGHRAGRPQD